MADRVFSLFLPSPVFPQLPASGCPAPVPGQQRDADQEAPDDPFLSYRAVDTRANDDETRGDHATERIDNEPCGRPKHTAGKRSVAQGLSESVEAHGAVAISRSAMLRTLMADQLAARRGRNPSPSSVSAITR